jgi:hypothetical protein
MEQIPLEAKNEPPPKATRTKLPQSAPVLRQDLFGLRSLAATWHPICTRIRQAGAPFDQRSYVLEEARAVGALVLRNKLAGKLGLTWRRAFRLLLGLQKTLPTTCGNSG